MSGAIFLRSYYGTQLHPTLQLGNSIRCVDEEMSTHPSDATSNRSEQRYSQQTAKSIWGSHQAQTWTSAWRHSFRVEPATRQSRQDSRGRWLYGTIVKSWDGPTIWSMWTVKPDMYTYWPHARERCEKCMPGLQDETPAIPRNTPSTGGESTLPLVPTSQNTPPTAKYRYSWRNRPTPDWRSRAWATQPVPERLETSEEAETERHYPWPCS